MREFKTQCVDNETKMQMILSECSYNVACSWLEAKGFTDYKKLEVNGSETWLWFSERLFVYDEDRGYLLGN